MKKRNTAYAQADMYTSTKQKNMQGSEGFFRLMEFIHLEPLNEQKRTRACLFCEQASYAS